MIDHQICSFCIIDHIAAFSPVLPSFFFACFSLHDVYMELLVSNSNFLVGSLHLLMVGAIFVEHSIELLV